MHFLAPTLEPKESHKSQVLLGHWVLYPIYSTRRHVTYLWASECFIGTIFVIS